MEGPLFHGTASAEIHEEAMATVHMAVISFRRGIGPILAWLKHVPKL
jgi:hypothetical protein